MSEQAILPIVSFIASCAAMAAAVFYYECKTLRGLLEIERDHSHAMEQELQRKIIEAELSVSDAIRRGEKRIKCRSKHREEICGRGEQSDVL